MTPYDTSRRGTHAATRSSLGPLLRLGLPVVIVLVVVLGIVQLLRSVPAPALRDSYATSHAAPGGPLSVPWPTQGTATVAVEGAASMGSYGGHQQFAIASLTKMMTALVILHDHPLSIGQSGPSFTVTPADVQLYAADKAQGDSVVAVTAGEQITELEALEATLIPSGDNVAQMLATWDAGSIPAFVVRMNQLASSLGLTDTHYAGPSGVNPATVSTAADQLKVAEAAMANPVFAGIVDMAQATLPVAGVVYNVNADLRIPGIVGVKTGWVPAGGGCFVFAAKRTVGGRSVTVVGDVLGQQGATPLNTALSDGAALASAAGAALSVEQVVSGGTKVAAITAPDNPSISLVTASSASLLAWPGATVTESLHLTRHLVAPIAKGTRVGYLTVAIGSEKAKVPVVTTASLSSPSLTWKLTRL